MSKKHRVLVGHNRAATRGVISDDNAHPFHIGNTTLVHNGTLSYVKGMSKYAVDSEALTDAFDSEGITALGDVYGAFAIVAHNMETGMVTVARNSERPLTWAATKDGCVLLASEYGMLAWLAERNSIDIKASGVLAQDMAYILDPRDLSKKPVEVVIPKPLPKPVPPYLGGTSHYGTSYIPARISKETRDSYGVTQVMAVRWLRYLEGDGNYHGAKRWGKLIGHTIASPFYRVQISGVELHVVQHLLEAGSIWNTPLSACLTAGEGSLDDPIFVTYQTEMSNITKVLTLARNLELGKLLEPVKPHEAQVINIGAGRFTDALGVRVSTKQWRRLVKDGCALCSKQFSRSDYADMAWMVEDDAPVCGECAGHFPEDVHHGHLAI